MVLYTGAGGTQPTIEWKYFDPASVVTVNVTGDAAGACTTNCTFRQAIARANTLTSPVLVQFTVSPGNMTQSADISIAGGGSITIDGTDSNGDPWIVGDATATAQGNQGPFPRVVDLQKATRLVVNSNDDAIRGLAIRNTASGVNQNRTLIFQMAGTTGLSLHSVQLDGGQGETCPDHDCGGQFDLVKSEGALTVANLDGASAIDKGFELSAATSLTMTSSWVHNNYRGNVYAASGMSMATLDSNMIERAGLRASDDTVQDLAAPGIYSNGNSAVVLTHANVVRNNIGNGMKAVGLTTFNLARDYICGNGGQGLEVVPSGGTPSVNGLGGITTAYNNEHGVSAAGGLTVLDSASSFLSNRLCGVAGVSSARYDQWRGSGPNYTDVCNIEDGDFSNVADPTAALSLDAAATMPSGALLKGQTLRVFGSNFDSIQGNPAPTATCKTGIPNVLAQSCCRQPAKANTCGSGSHNPVVGAGTCVELMDTTGTWRATTVHSGTPNTLVAEIGSSSTLFNCVGTLGETIAVSKRTPGGGLSLAVQGYCTNSVQPF